MPRNVMERKGMDPDIFERRELQGRRRSSLANEPDSEGDEQADEEESRLSGVSQSTNITSCNENNNRQNALSSINEFNFRDRERVINISCNSNNIHNNNNNNKTGNGGLSLSSSNSNNKKKSQIRHRHESTDTDGSEISATLEKQAVDGGWGWIIVGAAFGINLIADGITFSFGVFYVQFLEYFHNSKSNTAWIGSLMASMPLLSGPIASSLADRFGCRRITIAGSLIATTGFILSFFANSIWVVYLTFGVITGFGLSLCYVAAAVAVAYYFEEKRSFASGISACGGGIGTFLLAPVTQLLIDEYTWRGTVLILAGVFLNMCVCGVLMRDLKWTKKRAHNNNNKNFNGHSSPCADLEITMILKNERLCNSAICIPTFIKEEANNSSNSTTTTAVGKKYQNGFSPHLLENNTVNDKIATITTQNGSTNPNSLLTPLQNTLTPPLTPESNTNAQQHLLEEEQHPSKSSMKRYVVNKTSSWSGVHRHSLTYRGAVLSLKRYRLRPASSCPDIISVVNGAEGRNHSHEWVAVMGDVCRWIKGIFEWQHFVNSRFLLFLLSNFLLYMWYDIPYIYLQDAGMKSGYSDEKSTFLVSFIGIFNMIGNILLGYLGDKKWVEVTNIYAICMILCGASNMAIPTLLSYSYIHASTAASIFGLTIAANYSLTAVILVKIVSLERFAKAYGLLLLVQGIGNLIGPPIAGLIYDYTGDPKESFWVAGGGIMLSSVFIIAPKIISRCSNYELRH